jgi:hypothetical protein
MLRSIQPIIGYNVRAVNGDIGRIESFLLDDTIWSIRYLIVSMSANEKGNGKKTLIAPFSFGFLNSETRELPLSLEKQKIQKSPTVDLGRPISKQHQIQLYKYYEWPPFSKYIISNSMQYPMLMKIFEEKENDFSTHLLNTEKIIGYGIEAMDGEIGHIHDFIIDDEIWIIRYIAVEVGEPMSGKKVLVFPKVIKEVNQEEAKIYISLVKDIVMNSPEYNASLLIEKAYEVKLYQYYGFMRY